MRLHGLFRKTCIVITLGTLPVILYPKTASASSSEALDFDRETLKTLGLDPSVSQYFSQEARFAPGEIPVTLKINGNAKGSIIARFSSSGELCFDEQLLRQAGMQIPKNSHDAPCYDYRSAWPTTVITQHPHREELDIIVPTDALVRSSATGVAGDYQTGGNAGILNYSLFATRNEFDNSFSDYSQALLDGGMNISDWLLRTHQMLSYSEGRYNANNSSTWLQHTFAEQKTLMKVGEVNLNNTLLDGASIYGIAFSPDNALAPDGSSVEVNGIANTSQARVEIRQGSKLIYSTLVPQGPFRLTELPLNDRSSDLSVTVIETDGTQQRFIVPAAQYNPQVATPAGIHSTFGRIDDDYRKNPWVASVSVGKKVTNALNIKGGLITAENYQAAAAGVDIAVADITPSAQLALSNDRKNSQQGQKASVIVSYPLAREIYFRSSITHTTRQYRSLSDTLESDDIVQNKNEYSAGFNWSTSLLGSLNASYYQADSYQKSSDSRYITLSWSRSFRQVTLSANWQHQIEAGNVNANKDLIYVNLSVPLGRANVNLYSRHEDSRSRFGASVNGIATDEMNYSFGAERDTGDNSHSVNGGINANLHYTQLNLNASADSDHTRNYSASLQGGIVAHGNGITFSPWAIKDTFAIARLGSPIAGVKIDTPQGSVWTDAWGQAIVPALPAYRDALVQIRTESLPRNIDVGNASLRLKQGRGSVGNANFKMLQQRRAMLYISLLNGQKLPRGISIEDDKGNYVTTSVDEGIVFINNARPRQILIARLNNDTCRFHITLPENSDPNVFYDTAKEVCK